MATLEETKRTFLEKTLGLQKLKVDLKPDYYELLKVKFNCKDANLIARHAQEQLAKINRIPRNSPIARDNWDWLQDLKDKLSKARTRLSDAQEQMKYNRHLKEKVWGKIVHDKMLTMCKPSGGVLDDTIRAALYPEARALDLTRADVDDIIRGAQQRGEITVRRGGKTPTQTTTVPDWLAHVLTFLRAHAKEAAAGGTGLLVALGLVWFVASPKSWQVEPGQVYDVTLETGETYRAQVISDKDKIIVFEDQNGNNRFAARYDEIATLQVWQPTGDPEFSRYQAGAKVVVKLKYSGAFIGEVEKNENGVFVIKEPSGRTREIAHKDIQDIDPQ
ncbi:MAG: hypothetical protein ACE5IY_13720 [bacterium]